MVRKVFHILRNRPDSEHEQAVVRLLVGLVAATYVLSMLWLKGEGADGRLVVLLTTFFAAAFAIFFWIIIEPGENAVRRILGCVIDNGGATGMLWINGDLAAPVFIVYLWVAFGNGFRFGRKYLVFSMLLAILGFSIVLVFSDLWNAGNSVNVGLFVGLVALPLYVSSLLSRLENALVKAEAANEAKSNFLATMSHEIRTPLNGLIGLLDLLDVTNLRDRQKHYVELMKSSSQWLLNVISDGLDFTKIEAGELIVDPAPMDLEATIRDITNVYREVAAAKGIIFQRDIPDLKYKYILCDRNRLIQILNNLLGNACKFTQKGKVGLSVALDEIPDGDVQVSFTVEDTGVGITEEDLKDIFSPFKQVRRQNTDIQSGTGLGLAISSRLAGLMGGEIKVESASGKGSRFSLHIRVPVITDSEQLEKSPSFQSVQWKRPPQILLAEDNDVNREVASEHLHHLGCTTVAAANGLQAVELAGSRDFDLILMDCQMPVMDGYEAARRIRAQENGTRRKTIIALTAHVTEQDRKKCYEAGMDDYMGKPYKIEMLQNMLCKWLDAEIAAIRESDNPESAEESGSCKKQPTDFGGEYTIHDLRNSLTGVIGGVELAMLSTADPRRCEHHLQTAIASARKAIAISDRLE